MSDAILTVKPSVLSSAGYKYNSLYYSSASSSADLLECTFNWQNVIALPTLQMGSSSQVNLPMDQFIQDVVLHVRLPNVVANQTLPRGWLFSIIDSISYTFGNSNSTQIVLQNDGIFLTCMSQISDAEKRDEILRLAGEEVLTPLVAAPGEDVPNLDAWIVLPLPMSTPCNEQKLPIDSTMLSSNIVLTIQFGNNSKIYGGSGAPRPTAFLVAELLLRQGKLSNQSASVRSLMIAAPDLKYQYPFIHTQYWESPSFAGIRASQAVSACSITLNSFANADLVGVTFYVIKTTDKVPTDNSTPNPFNSDPISNLVVTFNNSTMFNFPGLSYKMTNMLTGDLGASYYDNSIVSPGAVAPFLSNPKQNYLIHLDFSRLRSDCYQQHMFNVMRMPNQYLRLNFNTSLSDGVTYVLRAIFHYNGVVEFANGTSLIRID